jgi:hypothetical protein
MQTNFDEIARQAELLAKENRKISWDAVALNVLLVPLLGVSRDTTDKRALAQTAMPDEWLQAVASLPAISQDGLKTLAADLAKHGFVSVEAALEFVEAESAAKSNVLAHESIQECQQAIGAAMLLARAERDLPGSIARFADSARDVVSAAAGVASFTIEKAIWVGKGVGIVATAMKDLRK